MAAIQESFSNIVKEPKKVGKMTDGSHVDMRGFYNIDPAYFRDYGERAGEDFINRETTLINEVVFTGHEDPFATFAMGGANLDIPTETDLEKIIQSANLPDVSSLIGSRVEVFKWGPPEKLIPFGINVLPREEMGMSELHTSVELMPGIPVAPTSPVAA